MKRSKLIIQLKKSAKCLGITNGGFTISRLCTEDELPKILGEFEYIGVNTNGELLTQSFISRYRWHDTWYTVSKG